MKQKLVHDYVEDGVPSPMEAADARANKCDRFFPLPQIIECFVDRANKELPVHYYAEPWTTNRSVSLFYVGQWICTIPYEDIEEEVVWYLDYICAVANAHHNERMLRERSKTN